MNEMVKKCYSCDFHRQECTFTLSVTTRPNPTDTPSKKRKLNDTSADEVDSSKRYVLYDFPLFFKVGIQSPISDVSL
jgi:hypothetical protein